MAMFLRFYAPSFLFFFQIDPRTSPIASSLRDRMVFYKLQIAPRATDLCSAFNNPVRAEIVPDHNDPYRIEWLDGELSDDILVGEKVGRDPPQGA
jgi:actin-related protein 8